MFCSFPLCLEACPSRSDEDTLSPPPPRVGTNLMWSKTCFLPGTQLENWADSTHQNGGQRGGGGWRGAGRPAPKSSAHAGRTRGLRVGAAPFSAREVVGTRGRSGAEEPGEGSLRRPPAAAMRSLPAADLPPPGSARGGRASGWPRGRPGRRGSVSGRARDEGPDRAS